MTVRLAALAVAGALLGGCASPAPDYSASAAADLQSRVLAVTEAAATGDALAALLRLQELEAAAYDAAARSLISQSRLASILSSIALVRADLEKVLSQAELAELQKRLEELEREQSAEEPVEQPDQGGGSPGDDPGPTDAEQENALKDAAEEAEEQRKKAEEQARKAEEEARKLQEEAQKKAAEAAKKQREAAEKDD